MTRGWGDVTVSNQPNWYLDPIVAGQKRDVNLRWFRPRLADAPPGPLLKTDTFEDAMGSDSLLADLAAQGRPVVAFDWLPGLVQAAHARAGHEAVRFLAADARTLPFASASVAVVVSPSTLDHFADRESLETSLAELARVVTPGGLLLLTLDNPHNPLYWLLRLLARLGWTPFPLGRTLSARQLDRLLAQLGFQVLDRGWLLHNPRGVSTGLFVGLRRVLGPRADRPIRALLRAFAWLGRLPTRRFTAAFVATAARRTAAVG